jgi:hypothetical protein
VVFVKIKNRKNFALSPIAFYIVKHCCRQHLKLLSAIGDSIKFFLVMLATSLKSSNWHFQAKTVKFLIFWHSSLVTHPYRSDLCKKNSEPNISSLDCSFNFPGFCLCVHFFATFCHTKKKISLQSLYGQVCSFTGYLLHPVRTLTRHGSRIPVCNIALASQFKYIFVYL